MDFVMSVGVAHGLKITSKVSDDGGYYLVSEWLTRGSTSHITRSMTADEWPLQEYRRHCRHGPRDDHWWVTTGCIHAQAYMRHWRGPWCRGSRLCSPLWHSGFKETIMFFPSSLVNIQYCEGLPWPKCRVLGLRPLGLEFRIMCLEGGVISVTIPV